jgi:hypothetical protein
MSLSSMLSPALENLRTRPLFVLRAQVPALLVVGQTPNGFRRIGLVQGGSFEGDRLSGAVVSGNDWQTVREDSCTKLDVRLVLRTADDALVAMTYTALRAGSPEVMNELDRGGAPDPSSYYFRMISTFETSAKKYDWLNQIIGVGIGDRRADGPVYNVFELL